MVDVTDCLGCGWKFVDGKPAASWAAGSPITCDEDTGDLSLGLVSSDLEVVSGLLGDKTHFAVGTGSGDFSSPISYNAGTLGSSLPGGGVMNTATSFGGTNITNPFTAAGIVKITAHSNIEVNAVSPAGGHQCRGIISLEVQGASGDPWTPVHAVLYRAYSSNHVANTSWQIPYYHTIAASATLTPLWRLTYALLSTSPDAGDHPSFVYADAVATNWEIHRT